MTATKATIDAAISAEQGDHFRFLLAIYRLAKQGQGASLTTETISEGMNRVSGNTQIFPKGASRLEKSAVNGLAEELRASGYIDYTEAASGGGFLAKFLHRKDPNRTIAGILPTKQALDAMNLHISHSPLAYAEFHQLHPDNFPQQSRAR